MDFVVEHERGTYEYLSSLSAAQRDEHLATIEYVEHPKVFSFPGGEISMGDIFNYSLLYERLGERAKQSIFDPSLARTGDIVDTGAGYRGVGTYYCMWLLRDLATVEEPILHQAEAQLSTAPLVADNDVQQNVDVDLANYDLTLQQWRVVAELLGNETWYENTAFLEQYPRLWADISNDMLSDTLINRILAVHGPRNEEEADATIPRIVPRDAPGFHNDGQHHLYLFTHPDEMGYASSTAVSCAPNGYFTNREYTSAFIDPLLTHSQSYYAGLIRESKEMEQWAEDPEFPDNYIADCDRFYDNGGYDAEETQWTAMNDMEQWEHTTSRVRHMFSEHFRQCDANDYILK